VAWTAPFSKIVKRGSASRPRTRPPREFC